MKELFQYKYLSIQVEELDKQLKDAISKFKIDFKEYIINNDNDNKNNSNNDNDNDSIENMSDNEYYTGSGSETDSDDNKCHNDNDNDNDKNDDNDNDNDNNEENDNNREDGENDNNNKKEENLEDDSIMMRKKKKKRRKRKKKAEPQTPEEVLMLKLYRKLSKILHPDKNPACKNLFLKLKQYYDDKNLIEMVIIANLFDIDVNEDEIPNEMYIKNIDDLKKRTDEINNNFIWLLYYGDPKQKILVRQRLMQQLNKNK
tara:strand:+ start:129 stop:902 length:774 start_codon:yes stop_codon:yes gene_type:complete